MSKYKRLQNAALKSKCFLCENKLALSSMSFIEDKDLGLNIGYICNSCLESKSNELATLSPDIANDFLNSGKIELTASDINIFDEKSALASSEISDIEKEFSIDHKQNDLMYIKFKLVHANTNKNKDTFLKDELKAAKNTPVLKMLNWEHGEPNIGVIYSSKYVESSNDGEPDYLECLAAVSKMKYEDYAKEIYDRYISGNLTFSMETWYKEAKCSVCDEVFAGGEQTYCNHLKARFSSGSSTSRILIGITFAGAAVVKNPADVQAESLLMASRVKNKDLETTKEAQSSQMDNFTKEQVDAMIAEALKTLNDEKISLIASLDELTEKIKTLELSNTEAGNSKAELEAKLTSVSQEHETLKLEMSNNLKATNWISELRLIGYSIPEIAENKESYMEFFNKLKSMDENSFSLLKEFASKNSNSNSKASTSDKPKESTDNKEVINDDLDKLITASSVDTDPKSVGDNKENLRNVIKSIF